MAHDAALALVNDVHGALATLARTIISAIEDGSVSPVEGILLGMKGLTFASTIVALCEGTPQDVLHDMLYVLEHGTVIVNEPEQGGP